MNEKATIKQKAEIYASMFEPKSKYLERNNVKRTKEEKEKDENIIVFADNASETLKNAIYEVHKEGMLSDFIFEKFSSLLERIAERADDDTTEDDLIEWENEICDRETDVYTSDLTEWLNERNDNVYYLNDALEAGVTDGFQLLRLAQYTAISSVYNAVVDLLTSFEA